MFKKLISFVLIVSMVLLISLIPVSATDIPKYTQPLPYAIEGDTVVFYEEDGWTVYRFQAAIGPMPLTVRVGKYIFCKSYDIPYKLGIYVEKDGVVLYLEDAYEHGIIKDMDTLVANLEKSSTKNVFPIDIYVSGDVNQDKEINVEDVLEMQRYLADLKVTPKYDENDPRPWEEYMYFFDHNLDGQPTISDALSMQKDLANI